jgi:predicted HicB family RNase H-like nuclease
MIDYKGYTGVFEFDPSIDAFHGHVIGLQDVVTFEGRSLDDLRQQMAESVEDYVELCAEVGKDPERPFRGEFLVRKTPELHRLAATEAEASGKSLNAWVEATIARVVREHPPLMKPSVRPRSVTKGTKAQKSRRRSPSRASKAP